MNRGLLREVFRMALETLRTNKLRSGLTVLGVVIGITSIVGMTSLLRGFDESLRDTIRALGPNTIFVAKISGVSFASGADFADADAAAELERRRRQGDREAGAVGRASSTSGSATAARSTERAVLPRRAHHADGRLGATEHFADVNFVAVALGRFFTAAEVEHRRRVVVLGYNAYDALFAALRHRPDRQEGTRRRDRVHRRRRAGQAAIGGFGDQDDFVVIPQTTHQVVYGGIASRSTGPRQHGDRSSSSPTRTRARPGVCRSRGDHAHPARPEAGRAERLRHRHPGRAAEASGIRSATASSWRWW